ncbi:MAG: fimbrillin family protein [Rikenellaceae bacterium]
MKKILYIISMAVALTTFASCQKDADVDSANASNDNTVQFMAQEISTMTKVSGTVWDKGDAIGIMATSTDAAAAKVNAKYTTTGGSPAEFTPTDAQQTIYFSESGTAVTFDAYSPYQEDWSASYQVMDITAQNQGSEDDVDLMRSATLADQTSGVQSLNFSHSFTKVIFNVNNFEGDFDSAISSFEDMNIEISGVMTQYDLLEDSYTTSGAITMHIDVSDDGQSATATAILLPTTTDAKVTITADGQTYQAALKVDPLLEGMQYTYSMEVGESEVQVTLTSQGIEAWSSEGTSTPTELFAEVDGVYTVASQRDMEIFYTLLSDGQDFSGKSIVLDCDISLADITWLLYSENQQPFQGTLDGQGHTISDLAVVYEYSALLPNIGEQGVVKNIIFDSGSSSRSNTAAVAYKNYGTIANCHNNGFAITSNGYSSASIASENYGTVINCSNSASVSCDYAGAAGIVSINYESGVVVNCYNWGEVSSPSNQAVAGVVYANSGAVTACYSAVEMDASTGNAAAVVFNNTSGSITACYFDSTLCSVGVVSGDSGVEGLSTEEMQGEDIIIGLNNGAYIYNQTPSEITAFAWQAVEGDYPAFDSQTTPTYTKTYDITFDTDSSTYLIYTENGLIAFADLVNGSACRVSDLMVDNEVYFQFGLSNRAIDGKLVKNIALQDAWTPIAVDGSESSGYSGVFDGNGYSVTGLSISGSASGQGLFAACAGATIKNLKVGGSVSNAGGHTALLIGKGWYTTVENCQTLEGSTVTETSSDSAAGIMGYSRECSFTSCINRADVTGTKYTAGIAGYSNFYTEGTIITDCQNYGDIKSGSYVGGIAGGSSGTSIMIISNCYNQGDITTTSGNFAGGIMGKLYGMSTDVYGLVINCANVGEVTCVGQYSGGLVGASQGGAIYNSYNTGDVYAATSHVGGLVGINEAYDTYYDTILNGCYSSGKVSGATSYIGAVVGYNSSVKISSCYYDSDVCSLDAVGDNTGTVTDVLGYSTEIMQSGSFVTTLNNGAFYYNEPSPSIKAYAWAEVSGAYYPVHDPNGTPELTIVVDPNITSCTGAGGGIEGNPYLIINAAQMRDLSTQVAAKNYYAGIYFKMLNNIDLGGEDNEFTAIGSSSSYCFSGIFDGDGYKITGLYINQEDVSNQGLFGYVYGGTIKNLGVEGDITGASYAAGIVGYLYERSSVDNCYFSGTVTVTGQNAGGIVGRLNTSNVSNCYNKGTINKEEKFYSGGIVASVYSSATITSQIVNCYNVGTVNGTSGYYAGAILGYSSSSSYLTTNCYYLEGCAAAARYGSTSMSKEEMTDGTLLEALGDEFKADYDVPINDGYPIFTWQ